MNYIVTWKMMMVFILSFIVLVTGMYIKYNLYCDLHVRILKDYVFLYLGSSNSYLIILVLMRYDVLWMNDYVYFDIMTFSISSHKKVNLCFPNQNKEKNHFYMCKLKGGFHRKIQ